MTAVVRDVISSVDEISLDIRAVIGSPKTANDAHRCWQIFAQSRPDLCCLETR